MASGDSVPGPHAGQPNGYSGPARGVISGGHVYNVSTAYFARNILIDPARSADDRRQAFVCLQTIVDAQISQSVIATASNVAGLDGRGTWYNAVGDTTGSGPHFNLEDFIGSAILQVFHHDAVKDHADWPEHLAERLRETLAESVRCGQRRSVRLSYTNPVAMGIECSALAGELLGVSEFVEYARRRLVEWRAFTQKAGTFEEFNSSCYGGVTLPHIAYLAEMASDEDIRAKALYMERLYFEHVCGFFHGPTGELCMPQARAYSDRLSGTQLHDYLSGALADRGLASEACAAGLAPPPAGRRAGSQYFCHASARQIERLLRAFARPVETRVFCEWIGCDHVGPLQQVPPAPFGSAFGSEAQARREPQGRRPPITPTRRRELVAWRTRRYCLGSVNEIDSWHQRRALGGFVRVAPTSRAGRLARETTLCHQTRASLPALPSQPQPEGRLGVPPLMCCTSAMVSWKPVVKVAGADDNNQDQLWPTMMFFNLCTGQHRTTVLAGLTGIPIDDGWLCGSHWRQKVSGKVNGIKLDFGFDLAGLDQGAAALLSRRVEQPQQPGGAGVPLGGGALRRRGVAPPQHGGGGGAPPRQGLDAAVGPFPIGQPWRLDIAGTAVTLLFLGGHVGDIEAEPRLVRTDGGWRVSFLRAEGLTLDWSDPPEVGLAFLLDISPAGKSPALSDWRWQSAGTRLWAQVTAGGNRLALSYDPPKLAELTRKACEFEVKQRPGQEREAR